MNVGDPNRLLLAGIVLRESDMPVVLLIVRTAQPYRREGALLKLEFQMNTDRPIEEWKVINSKSERNSSSYRRNGKR